MAPARLAAPASADAPDRPAFRRSAELAGSRAEPARPPTAVGPTSGLLRVETLAATLEEVDFLTSLGLYPESMDVVKAYLQDSASPAPVAFFELMRVCGLADDPQAVEAVRRRYAKVFGQPAPRLEQVTDPAGLEAQPAVSAKVIARWAAGDVLPVIEQALFDKPAAGSPLTPQSARDLISLYDMAMLLAAEDQAAVGPRAPQEPALAPWAHAEHAHEAHALARAVVEDFGSHRFAVDIDLTVVPRALPEKPPQPDAQEVAARLMAEKEARQAAAARAAAEAEEAFNAAVAFERTPVSRF
jgi:hypothetical protein